MTNEELLEFLNEKFNKMDSRFDNIEKDISDLKSNVAKMDSRLDKIEEDIEVIKEDAEITRETTNAIGEWVDYYFHEEKPYPIDKEEIEKQKEIMRFAK